MNNDEVRELIWQKGIELFRTMPWRDDTRPYYVLVSELMLQQTQVARVIPKFEVFIQVFPTSKALSEAELADVLILWQGLGYNRRAKFLHESAKMIEREFDGHFPSSERELLQLPGVGKNTAGAIMAYAFNQPAVFVETNVRTVLMHHLFPDQTDVQDKAIINRLQEVIDYEHPREFYWALMDYGSWLKANGIRNNSMSIHYKRQSPLEGSVRQMRGWILKQLVDSDYDERVLRERTDDDPRYDEALRGLLDDGLVTLTDGVIHLTK